MTLKDFEIMWGDKGTFGEVQWDLSFEPTAPGPGIYVSNVMYARVRFATTPAEIRAFSDLLKAVGKKPIDHRNKVMLTHGWSIDPNGWRLGQIHLSNEGRLYVKGLLIPAPFVETTAHAQAVCNLFNIKDIIL